MNNVAKGTGILLIAAAIMAGACQRGPHKETWGAGKPKKTLEKKK